MKVVILTPDKRAWIDDFSKYKQSRYGSYISIILRPRIYTWNVQHHL